MHHTNYLRLLQLRRGGMLAPDTGTSGGGVQAAPDGQNAAQNGAEGAQAQEEGKANENGQNAAQSGERTFTQADVNAILARERAKAERAQQKAVNEAVTEAQRLARMTEDEREEHERQAREKDYERRMAELNRRELEVQVRQTLREKGVPEHYAPFVDMRGAEEANASIEALGKLIRSDMEAAKAQKAQELIGSSAGTPRTGNAGAPMTLKDAIAAPYNRG